MPPKKCQKLILGVDIGTTNIKCYAYDQRMNVIGNAHERLSVLDFNDGRHEISPEKLWNAFINVIKMCLIHSSLSASDITSIGISTQRGTFTTWDSQTGETFHNFITWKDTRSESFCRSWNSSIINKLLKFGAYGLYIITRRKLFRLASAFKCMPGMVLMRLFWLLENDPIVKQQIHQPTALFGTIDTWLVWKLTGGKVHATDTSNASVSGFFDPLKLEWSNVVLDYFKVPKHILPVVKNTCDDFGTTMPSIFGAPILIRAVVGDQQASTFAACCFEKNDVSCSMGTGAFVNINSGSNLLIGHRDFYPLVGWTILSKTTYIAEYGVHDFGGFITMAQHLGLFENPNISSNIANSASVCETLYFLPNVNKMTSSFIGLTKYITKQNLVKAILESLAFQVCNLLECASKLLRRQNLNVKLCGGVSKNEFIVQLISNISNCRVDRLCHEESSSLGAALFAGFFCEVWKTTDDIRVMFEENSFLQNFTPAQSFTDQYQERFNGWKKALSC